MSRRALTMFTFTVLLGGTTVITFTTSPAQADEDIPEIRQLYQEGTIQSLESVVARARKRYPGSRLVEAELLKRGERLIYEVELIDAEGVVRELFFDARTGEAVSEIEEEVESH